MIALTSNVCCFLLLLLIPQNQMLVSTCETQTFGERRQERELDTANITYYLNIMEHSNYSGNFKVLFEICEGHMMATHCMFIWKRQSNKLSTVNWSPGNKTTCFAQHRDLGNSMFAFDIHISVPVRRSFRLMELSITGTDDSFRTLRLIGLDVLYLPNVTKMTVNGHEAKGDYLINEGQNVTAYCSFDKGNPPAYSRMLDKQGQEIGRTGDDGSISQTFVVKCEDDWPIITCEGHGSIYSRSVSFLVRCPPQFLDNSTKVIRPSAFHTTTFRVKAHTSAAVMCVLTTTSFEEDTIKDVNCTLHGDPPDLTLSLHLDNESRVNPGKWLLILRNDKGSAKKALLVPEALKASECDLFVDAKSA